MTPIFSGPMFEPAVSEHWVSVHRKEGGHYNNFGCRDEDGMTELRDFFPNLADEFNQCLFSTSGVHGSYTTIEDAEEQWKRGNKYEDFEDCTPTVTFLIVQPRICTLRHGNCQPKSQDDFDFLKRLRESSWKELIKIGKP